MHFLFCFKNVYFIPPPNRVVCLLASTVLEIHVTFIQLIVQTIFHGSIGGDDLLFATVNLQGPGSFTEKPC